MSIGFAVRWPACWWIEQSVPSTSYRLFEEIPLESQLAANLLTLARDLRDSGLNIGSGQVINLVDAVSVIDCNRRDDFYSAAKSTLVTSPEQIPVFDVVFARFWRRLLRPETLEQDALDQHQFDMPPAPSDPKKGAEVEKKKPQAGKGETDKERAVMAVEDSAIDDQSKTEDLDALPEDVIVFSAREVLRKKDFAQFSPDEIAEARRIISGMSWRLGTRETRRLEKAPHGDFIDYRRTLRHSLKHGGVPLELRRRRRKEKMRPLVLICDISGSMDRYSRLLLQFVHALEQGLDSVEVFVFSTRLTRITRELRKKNVDSAIEQVVKSVHDWSGGTRIGESIKAFNYEWSRRVLRSGATVVMISDGWDRGDPQLLATEMARLQRSCRRLIWLNPLLGAPGYQPLTQGIRAALPFVDAFLPIHNLKSLEALAKLLGDMDDSPPVRANRSIRPVSSDSLQMKPFVNDRGHLLVDVGPMMDGKRIE
ncbi:MAG: VWA domain-containing protein, partial [Thermomicrobiales bacterium]|nr:VWA domain-containing protein [Thermomicrobiales bacterium]